MSFLEYLKSDEEKLDLSYRYTVNGEYGAYFECIDDLVSFSPEKIVMLVKRRKLVVTGEKLSVLKYYLKDVYITGKVKKVETENV